MRRSSRTHRKSSARERKRGRAPAPPSLILGGVVGAALLILSAGAGYSEIKASRPGSPQEQLHAWSSDQKSVDAETIASAARTVLDRRPMDSEAARTVALLYDKAGESGKARTMMGVAQNLNRRDLVVNLWQFGDAMQQRDYDRGYTTADAVLRVRVGVGKDFYPYMLTGLNDPAARPALARRLIKKPEWRDDFMLFAASKATRLEAPFELLSAIKSAGGEVTPFETSLYVTRLVEAGLVDQAYLNFILFMPQEQLSKLRNVYDGDFEGWPAMPPFTWNFSQGYLGNIQNAAAHGRDEGALRVEYDGFTRPNFVRQLLFLTPGAYRLSGQALTATYEAPGRLEWTVSCRGAAPPPLVRVPVPDTERKWKAFAVDFQVNAACPSQWLELKPLPGDRRGSVEVWYDDINIDPKTP